MRGMRTCAGGRGDNLPTICTYAQVRRVEVDKIRGHLQSGEIVLLGALGYSASGDVFNVKSEEVASGLGLGSGLGQG